MNLTIKYYQEYVIKIVAFFAGKNLDAVLKYVQVVVEIMIVVYI